VIKGQEAMAVVSLMLLVESLQGTIKAAMKQGEDSRDLLMPLTETVSSCFFSSSFDVPQFSVLNVLQITCRF
jgi:hypothetical protein